MRLLRGRAWFVGGFLAGCAILAGLLLVPRTGHQVRRFVAGPRGGRSAEAVRGNYKTLSPQRSLRLLRFAQNVQGCISARGVHLGTARPLATRIEMTLPPDAERQALREAFVPCAERFGGPPTDASLVIEKHAVTLYLPKRCLLDPNTKHVSGIPL